MVYYRSCTLSWSESKQQHSNSKKIKCDQVAFTKLRVNELRVVEIDKKFQQLNFSEENDKIKFYKFYNQGRRKIYWIRRLRWPLSIFRSSLMRKVWENWVHDDVAKSSSEESTKRKVTNKMDCGQNSSGPKARFSVIAKHFENMEEGSWWDRPTNTDGD